MKLSIQLPQDLFYLFGALAFCKYTYGTVKPTVILFILLVILTILLLILGLDKK